MKLVTFLVFTSLMALAQTPDTIVVRIDGKPVTAAELTAILQANPPEARKNMLKDVKAFVEQLALMRKLQAMAEQAKLDQKSPFKEQLDLFRMQTLANAQVSAATDAIPVTLDEQKKFYEANRDRYTQAKVKVLQEEIEHHVEEEEKPGGVFAQARKGKLELDALGEQLAARKKELTSRYKEGGLPQPQVTTMDEVSV